MASASEFQHTVGKIASLSGTSLHTGEKVSLKLHPAPVDHGIKFKRRDLQDEPTIDATIDNLKTVERATTIGEGSVRVHTVEHVLAALSAMAVDNAIVEMDANEPPIGDGSAQPYVDIIKKAGVTAQEEPQKFFDVREPMHVESKTGALLVLLPDEKFRISCTQKCDCRARGGRVKQGTIAFCRRIRAAQNSRYHRRSRAGRTAHSRAFGSGKTRPRYECGAGSRAFTRADAKKRDGCIPDDAGRGWRARH